MAEQSNFCQVSCRSYSGEKGLFDATMVKEMAGTISNDWSRYSPVCRLWKSWGNNENLSDMTSTCRCESLRCQVISSEDVRSVVLQLCCVDTFVSRPLAATRYVDISWS